MKVKPLHDRVLVRRIEGREAVASGIIIPDTAKEKPQQGEVIEVGRGALLEDGRVVPLDVKVGDRILFGRYSGAEVRIGGDEEYLVLREDEVLAALDGPDPPETEQPVLRGGSEVDVRIMTRFEELRDLLEKHAPALLLEPGAGIRCLAIGRKNAKAFESSIRVEDLCITAYVDRKLPKSRLRKGASVAAMFSSHALKGGEATRGGLRLAEILDVVECGSRFQAGTGLRSAVTRRGHLGGRRPAIDPQKPHASLKSGLGITNPHLAYPSKLSVGTLGFFVRDESAELHLVSNNHVIGDSNGARPGEPVVQPGTLDLTAAEIKAHGTEAKLVRSFGVAEISAVVSLQYTAPGAKTVHLNEVDAAMARLRLRDEGFRRETNDLSRLAFAGCILGIAPPYAVDDDGLFVGEPRVYKVGRTTGYTEGRIMSLLGTAVVDYDPRGATTSQTACFRRLLVIAATADNVGPFSDHGDSGSAVLTAKHDLAGLLFAVSAEGQTLASPIDAVLSELQVAYGKTLRVVTA